MGRYLLYIAYIGTNYSGLQKQVGQKGVKTIQGQLEVGLKIFSPLNPVSTFISSRTDAGVHSLENTLHVDLIPKDSKHEQQFDPQFMKKRLNAWLRKQQDSIVVTNVLQVPEDFHCQRQVVSRTYMYRLAIPWKTIGDHLGYGAMNFFEAKRAQIIYQPVNIKKLMVCAELMVGTHDYTSFTTIKSLQNEQKDPIKTVSIEVKLGSTFLKTHNPGLEFWEIHITSRSFLYRQIRRMVGVMIQVSLDYLSLDEVRQMLLDPDLNFTNTKIRSSPAHGLYLKNVTYNSEDLIYNPDSCSSAEASSTSNNGRSSENQDNT